MAFSQHEMAFEPSIRQFDICSVWVVFWFMSTPSRSPSTVRKGHPPRGDGEAVQTLTSDPKGCVARPDKYRRETCQLNKPCSRRWRCLCHLAVTQGHGYFQRPKGPEKLMRSAQRELTMEDSAASALHTPCSDNSQEKPCNLNCFCIEECLSSHSSSEYFERCHPFPGTCLAPDGSL